MHEPWPWRVPIGFAGIRRKACWMPQSQQACSEAISGHDALPPRVPHCCSNVASATATSASGRPGGRARRPAAGRPGRPRRCMGAVFPPQWLRHPIETGTRPLADRQARPAAGAGCGVRDAGQWPSRRPAALPGPAAGGSVDPESAGVRAPRVLSHRQRCRGCSLNRHPNTLRCRTLTLPAQPMTTEPILPSTLSCPRRGHTSGESMPTNACLLFHECVGCGGRLRSKAGDCCVSCSCASVPCPPIQQRKSCCG